MLKRRKNMKRRIILSIALVFLSLTTSDSMAKSRAAVWVTVGFFEVAAPEQTVLVDTPRDIYAAVFHNEVQVRNGRADGFLTLTVPDGGSAPHTGGITVLFVDRSLRFTTFGAVGPVRIRARISAHPNRRITIIITPAATEDCLIYTTVGTDFHATWEAQGRLTVRE